MKEFKEFLEREVYVLCMFTILIAIRIYGLVCNIAVDIDAIDLCATMLGLDLFMKSWFTVVMPVVMRTCPKK